MEKETAAGGLFFLWKDSEVKNLKTLEKSRKNRKKGLAFGCAICYNTKALRMEVDFSSVANAWRMG